MKNLKLNSDEGVVLQTTGVSQGELFSMNTGELILTNKNIYFIKHGIFFEGKEMKKWSLKEIKVINSIPQIRVGKNPIGNSSQLQICFENSQESFEFELRNKRKIQEWINEIYKLFGITVDSSKNYIINKNQANTIHSEISIKDTSQINTFEKKVTIKCSGCKALLVGKSGETVVCNYCDTKQTLY